MKSKLYALIAVLIAAMLLSSCRLTVVRPVVKDGDSGGYYSVYLTVSAKYYEGEEMSLAEYMAAVSEAGEFSYEAEASDYGAYLTSVNGRAADEANREFWSLYTSNETYNGGFGDTYEFGGKTLYPASLGMDGLPVEVGEVVAFILMTW